MPNLLESGLTATRRIVRGRRVGETDMPLVSIVYMVLAEHPGNALLIIEKASRDENMG